MGTFSAQYPPTEWFNPRVVHLHSVATQTRAASPSVSFNLMCSLVKKEKRIPVFRSLIKRFPAKIHECKLSSLEINIGNNFWRVKRYDTKYWYLKSMRNKYKWEK